MFSAGSFIFLTYQTSQAHSLFFCVFFVTVPLLAANILVSFLSKIIFTCLISASILIQNDSVFSLLCRHLLLRAVLRPRAAAPPADISCPPGPQQQTRRTLLQRANGTDRWRTDAVPLYRPCSAYCTGSANKLDPTWGKRNTGNRRHDRLKFEERLFSCSGLTACNSLRS